MKIVFEEELKGPTGPIGKLGALPRCPKCGAYHLMWDPETDISKCRSCGYENTEQAKQNFEKQLRYGERSADEAKAYTIRKENAVPFTMDEPNDEWLRKHAEDVEKVMKSNVVMGRLYAAIDEKAAVVRETVEDRILCEWQLKRADVENALRERDAYRATGLTPEQVEMDHEAAEELRRLCRDYDLGRLEGLAEADKDGRVIVLPCKVGDTVYEVTSRKTISEYRVKAIRTELFCTFIEWDIIVGFVDKSIFGVPVDEIGKTVFLAREEAEKALEEGHV